MIYLSGGDVYFNNAKVEGLPTLVGFSGRGQFFAVLDIEGYIWFVYMDRVTKFNGASGIKQICMYSHYELATIDSDGVACNYIIPSEDIQNIKKIPCIIDEENPPKVIKACGNYLLGNDEKIYCDVGNSLYKKIDGTARIKDIATLAYGRIMALDENGLVKKYPGKPEPEELGNAKLIGPECRLDDGLLFVYCPGSSRFYDVSGYPDIILVGDYCGKTYILTGDKKMYSVGVRGASLLANDVDTISDTMMLGNKSKSARKIAE